MINRHSPILKGLTPSQRAKARKAIAQYEAERDPVMIAKNKLEQELRRQGFIDLKCEDRVRELHQATRPRLLEIQEQIEKLDEERRAISKATYDAESLIKGEPYMLAYENPQVKAYEEIWNQINTRHEAKMTELLESFKESEVA
jgi:hypothetical protein